MAKYLREAYHQFNLAFVFLFTIILLYPAIFSPKSNYPISSGCKGLPPEYCKSRGLQRAFSSLLMGNWSQAQKYNVHVFRVFAFFVWQITQRLIISFLLIHYKINNHKMATADAVISFATIAFSFYPFI